MSENNFRIGLVSRWTGIHRKRIEKWCEKGDFIPEHIKSNPSLNQQYTQYDLRNLYIIAMFRQIGFLNIKDINKMLAGIWDEDTKVADILYESAERRKKYLNSLSIVVDAVKKHGVEKVFSAYAQILLNMENEKDNKNRIQEAFEHLANQNFETVTPFPVSQEKMTIQTVVKITGINRRTMYRLYDYFKSESEEKRLFCLEDCYTFFYILLIRQVETKYYTREFMFGDKNVTQEEIADFIDTSIDELQEAVGQEIDTCNGIENAVELLRKIGSISFTAVMKLMMDTCYYKRGNDWSFEDVIWIAGKEKTFLGDLVDECSEKISVNINNNDYLKYAKEILKYGENSMKNYCDKIGTSIEELVDDTGIILDQLENREAMMVSLAGMLMSIENVDLCEKFVRSISSVDVTDMFPDGIRILMPMFMLKGSNNVILRIDECCGDRAGIKVISICIFTIICSQIFKWIREYLKQIQDIRTANPEKFNARKKDVQAVTSLLVDKWKNMDGKEINPEIFWDNITKQIKSYVFLSGEFEDVRDYAIEAVRYSEKKESGNRDKWNF